MNQENNSSLENQLAEINIFDFIKFLFTHRYFLFIIVLAVPSIMGLWTFFIKKPVYKAYLDIHINLSSNMPSTSPGMFAGYYTSMEKENKIHMTELLFSSAKYRETLHSEITKKSVFTKDHPNIEKKKDVIIRYFGKNVFHPKGGSYILSNQVSLAVDLERYIVSLSSTTQRPEVSSALVDVAAHVLVKLNYQSLIQQVDFVESFLREQSQITKKRLSKYENKLAVLQKKHKIFSIDNVQDMVSRQHLEKMSKLREVHVAYETTVNFIEILKKDLLHLRAVIASKKQPSYLYLDQLQQRLDLLKFQNETKGLYRDLANEDKSESQIEKLIVKTKESFNKLNKENIPASMRPWDYYKILEKSLSEFKQEASKLKGEIKALENDVVSNEKQLLKLPEILQDMGFLNRRVTITSDLYRNLQTKLQETQISKAGQTNDLKIYSNSEMPGAPAGLGIVKKYILSIVGGLGIGSICLVLYYMLIPTVRSRRDLEIMGLRIIGEVPWYRKTSSGKVLSLNSKPSLLLKEDPHSMEAHSIRHARFNLEKEVNLHQARNEGYGRVVTVCSVQSGEGKTFNTVNLAYSLSAAKFKTIILDLDLRKPNISEYFGGLPEGKDLPYLNNDTRIEFQLHHFDDYIDVVDAPRIHENVCDYLEGIEFRDLIHEMKEKYDIIIIDTPPLAANLEPLITTQYSDAILFVTNQRKTVLTDIRHQVEQIQKYFKKPMLGLINFIYDDIMGPQVNKVDERESKKAS